MLAAEKDQMFPLERSRALAAGISGARFEVVPDGSHALVIEKAGEVARILQEFLASVT